MIIERHGAHSLIRVALFVGLSLPQMKWALMGAGGVREARAKDAPIANSRADDIMRCLSLLRFGRSADATRIFDSSGLNRGELVYYGSSCDFESV